MNFVNDLQKRDFASVRFNLHRLIARHPLARSVSRDELFHDTTAQLKFEDFAQELFLTLWQKNRFLHYLEAGMTDTEISAQISRIEIGNFLVKKISSHKPESFRLSRRISSLVQTGKAFKRFDAPGKSLRFSRYGLANWSEKRIGQSLFEMEKTVHDKIPIQRRDNRLTGRGGETELIISSADLENLIRAVFLAIDSPADIRTLRRLVLSRLPVMDFSITPITVYSDAETDESFDLEFTDAKPTPEQNFLQIERISQTETLVEHFFSNLFNPIVSKREAQKTLILKILWRCFLDESSITRTEFLLESGVSKSLVYLHYNRIIAELQKLGITDTVQANYFEFRLRAQVKEFLSNG